MRSCHKWSYLAATSPSPSTTSLLSGTWHCWRERPMNEVRWYLVNGDHGMVMRMMMDYLLFDLSLAWTDVSSSSSSTELTPGCCCYWWSRESLDKMRLNCKTFEQRLRISLLTQPSASGSVHAQEIGKGSFPKKKIKLFQKCNWRWAKQLQISMFCLHIRVVISLNFIKLWNCPFTWWLIQHFL